MNRTNSSNATIKITLALLSTTSLLFQNCNVPFESELMPKKTYNLEYGNSQRKNKYYLKHETSDSKNNNEFNDVLISPPIIKTMKVKFKKPTPLIFASIEDDEGFIE